MNPRQESTGARIGTNQPTIQNPPEKGKFYIRHNGQQFISGRTFNEGKALNIVQADDFTNWTLEKILVVSRERFKQLFPQPGGVYEVEYSIRKVS